MKFYLVGINTFILEKTRIIMLCLQEEKNHENIILVALHGEKDK